MESRAQRERARLDMEALDAEEARLERQEVYHQAMVHQPQGGVMRGRTSARYGVDISHLSADGQRIYSEMQ